MSVSQIACLYAHYISSDKAASKPLLIDNYYTVCERSMLFILTFLPARHVVLAALVSHSTYTDIITLLRFKN
jgi:hypothetical protein